MIVDLLRNDLSQVCVDESVQVTAVVPIGDLRVRAASPSRQCRGRCDLGSARPQRLRAAFPGGSITGAPRIRA